MLKEIVHTPLRFVSDINPNNVIPRKSKSVLLHLNAFYNIIFYKYIINISLYVFCLVNYYL